ncbi:type I-C CRISPR-associated protein Cas7/Csd2 [Roseofilum sp. BLCC_M91]|uniref:Type I-C CRISPR-associated protein Cas7/Csd2 n=1 Tax=Roseofilum halophilum BLCC-M91 TaxID=3022259 RepID=A0ABT7BPL7_9CYAN|nr:type I-C CRISPR-associated protein Cas7/Csd2 [Roseofilum halophilum]MDJ1181139.1 type I-C CRISPR-associated protein Cas7/Csd2 [Roseofilum halophilum BLCC-M91]
MTKQNDPTKRHDAIVLFDCTNSNPNGDPDALNAPRMDITTQHGLVTDAAIKRKIRNYVLDKKQGEEGYKIFVTQGAILNDAIKAGYDALTIKVSKAGNPEQQAQVQAWMQQQYWDIRMFGAVLSTGMNAGQVWGPVQVGFGSSVDPIEPMTVTLTRCAATDGKEGKDNKTMGTKEIIPYGLYRAEISYNPNRASDAVTSADLELFWEALLNCWENSDSSSKRLDCQGLMVFTHESKLGDIPRRDINSAVSVIKKEDQNVPRCFSDYEVAIDSDLADRFARFR